MTRNRYRPSALLLLGISLVVLLGAGWCTAADSSSLDLALVGGTVYVSPTAAPMQDAVILIHEGKIQTVGKRGAVKVPKSAKVIDCAGKVIVAGFWNSHVHFTEPVWQNAATAPAAPLEQHMQEMLTRWGVTTAFDLGSNPEDTFALRKRIAEGSVAGPKIYMAGDIFPRNGIPVYLPAGPAYPQAGTPEEAKGLAMSYMSSGFDAVKLFTGSYQGNKPVIDMSEPVAQAAVEVAHAHGKPVFTHPQDRAGEDNALAAGVDVLAHTIPEEGEYTKDELMRMKAQHTALIPTLTLWEVVMQGAAEDVTQRFIQAGVNELKSYFDEGGTILFGTDVGFTQHYDTAEEYVLMSKSGMGWRDILASLTTNPARFFKAEHTGQLTVGDEGDVVVLDADPSGDVRNFARVDYTIRAGKVIYRK